MVIPESIKTILEKLAVSPREKDAIAIQIASYVRGPLPPPDVLGKYGDAVEDGAERIFRQYELQSDHRMRLENYVIREELRQSFRGQILGFILSIFGLMLSGVLACLGHEIIAGILGGSTIVSLTAVFVAGKVLQKDRKD